MPEDTHPMTTLWNNIQARAYYLRKHEFHTEAGEPFARAICEELERMQSKIEKLEKEKVPNKGGKWS